MTKMKKNKQMVIYQMHIIILLKTIALTNKIQYTSVKDIIATILIRQKYKYFPNITWEAVRIEGIFRDDISAYKCIECRENSEFYCAARQDQSINIPDYLFAEMESNVMGSPFCPGICLLQSWLQC